MCSLHQSFNILTSIYRCFKQTNQQHPNPHQMSDDEDTDIMPESPQFRTIQFIKSWPSVKEDLSKMANGELNATEIIEMLSNFKSVSYKSRFGKKRSLPKKQFSMLLEDYDDQLPTIFSRIAEFMLKDNTSRFPLFKKGINLEHTFRKEQVLLILCSMILCLFPRQQYDQPEQQLNFSGQLDFSVVFETSSYKTKAIMEYIKRQLNNINAYNQCLTIKRYLVKQNLLSIIKANSTAKMCQLTIKGDNQSIEDFYGQIKVDFANKYIGGGALGNGCVQEQIMFANHPQLHISQLLCQQMNPNQAIFFIGFKKYNKNQGYSYQTKYAGKQMHVYQYDQQNRAKQYIVAIDAMLLQRKSFCQYKQSSIKREILKAYCGFSNNQANLKTIVTGNWGCGAFGGNIQMKLLIQWIACSLANKKIVYCPFGSLKEIDVTFLEQLKSMKIEEVYNYLLRSSRRICNRYLLRQQRQAGNNNTKSEEISICKQIKKVLQLNKAQPIVL